MRERTRGGRPSDLTYAYLHIPKTAGTSVRTAIQRELSPGERIWLYSEKDGADPVEELRALPEPARRRLRLVFGHVRFGLHEALPQACRYVTMLRDPVRRVVSYYHHVLRVSSNPLHDLVTAERMDLVAFVRSSAVVQTDNLMTRFLSGCVPAYGKVGERELDCARRNLEDHFEAVLFQEAMVPSMRRLGQLLDLAIPAALVENVDPLRSAAGDLDSDVRAEIEEHVAVDRALYAFARERFGPEVGLS